MEETPTYNFREQSFGRYAWSQFRKNKVAVFSLFIIGLLVFIALFADLLANDQPLYVRYKGETYYPALTTIFKPNKKVTITDPETGKKEMLQFDIANWKQMKLGKVIWPPIPYSPDEPDPYNQKYSSPSEKQVYKNPEGKIVEVPGIFRHHLGTDQIGLDLAAGIIHGTRVSLTVGLVSVGIAALIGVLLGSLAGYFGDQGLKAYWGQYYAGILGALLGFFYAFIARGYLIRDAIAGSFWEGLFQLLFSVAIFVLFIWIFSSTGRLFKRIPGLNRQVSIPLDGVVMRIIEVLNSLPRLLLIISVASVFKEKNLFLVMAIIGLTSWTRIARFTRAEFLRTRNLDYIQAAKALGYPEWRVILRHALPNSLAPVFVAIAFGIASAILIESGLSFLGIGVPGDQITWGSLLSAGRERFEAWWMVVFPGIAIFITITAYNLIGETLRDTLDPRLKT